MSGVRPTLRAIFEQLPFTNERRGFYELLK
jgi:hypothetical protein